MRIYFFSLTCFCRGSNRCPEDRTGTFFFGDAVFTAELFLIAGEAAEAGDAPAEEAGEAPAAAGDEPVEEAGDPPAAGDVAADDPDPPTVAAGIARITFGELSQIHPLGA